MLDHLLPLSSQGGTYRTVKDLNKLVATREVNVREATSCGETPTRPALPPSRVGGLGGHMFDE